MAMKLMSSAFEDGGSIPKEHTCDGSDVSPPLLWSGVPEEARCLALICDDPDAPRGTWVHWVLWGLPPDATSLPARVPAARTLDGGARQGTNDFQRIGYGGPCPPSGTHRYYFKLFALDVELDLPPGATRADLERAMQGHVVAMAQLLGRYARTR